MDCRVKPGNDRCKESLPHPAFHCRTLRNLVSDKWLRNPTSSKLACHAGFPAAASGDPPEVVLRLGVKGADRKKIERFGSELVPLVTSGPPGVTGFAGGRPKATEIIGFWPALMRKELVSARVSVFTS